MKRKNTHVLAQRKKALTQKREIESTVGRKLPESRSEREFQELANLLCDQAGRILDFLPTVTATRVTFAKVVSYVGWDPNEDPEADLKVLLQEQPGTEALVARLEALGMSVEYLALMCAAQAVLEDAAGGGAPPLVN